MKSFVTNAGLLLTIALTAPAAEPKLVDCPPPPPGFPKFKMQEIATDFRIGYAVHICDVNGDGKPDIVVVDQHRVVWYENPTWKMRTILNGKTKPDNVCICSVKHKDQICFVLGAGWRPFDTKTPGTLQWLQRGKSLDDEWEMYPIPCDEPTVHRVQAIDFEQNGKGNVQIIVAPLMGREATKEKNWLDGRPVRILSYSIPKDPTQIENWKPEVISDNLHVCHNFCQPHTPDRTHRLFVASYEGVHLIKHDKDKWSIQKIGEGDQSNPKGSLGSSEIATGDIEGVRMSGGSYLGGLQHADMFIGAIEPWHGNRAVIYTYESEKYNKPAAYKRAVIDENLRWGHAVKFAYLEPGIEETGEQVDNFIVGVRDNPDPKLGDKFTEKCGVRIYRKGEGGKWDRYILEDGGVAVEDLAVADLNGDGKPDIIAVGRATGNCRIYWNQGK